MNKLYITTEIGVGEVIANFTHKLGIRQCEACGKRQALLDKIHFPRKIKAREFTEEEFIYYNELKKELAYYITTNDTDNKGRRLKGKIPTELANKVGVLWGKIFNRVPTEICATCPPTTLIKYLDMLEKVVIECKYYEK